MSDYWTNLLAAAKEHGYHQKVEPLPPFGELDSQVAVQITRALYAKEAELGVQLEVDHLEWEGAPADRLVVHMRPWTGKR